MGTSEISLGEAFALDIQALVERIQLPEGSYSAVFTGSVVEGLANPKSDIDIIVIVWDENVVSPSIPGMLFVASRRLETRYYGRKGLSKLIDRVHTLGEAVTSEGITEVDDEDLDVYHRILIGQPVINARAFKRFKARCSRERLILASLKWHFVKYVTTMTRCLEAIELGETIRSFWLARAASMSAIHYLLCSHGQTNPSYKWIFQLLDRVPGGEALGQQAWEIVSPGISPEEAGTYLSRCLEFVQALDPCLGLALNADLAALRPRRSSSTTTWSYGSTVYVANGKSLLYELGPEAAVVWRLSGGESTIGQIVRKVSRQDKAVSMAGTARVLLDLERSGLVRLERRAFLLPAIMGA